MVTPRSRLQQGQSHHPIIIPKATTDLRVLFQNIMTTNHLRPWLRAGFRILPNYDFRVKSILISQSKYVAYFSRWSSRRVHRGLYRVQLIHTESMDPVNAS